MNTIPFPKATVPTIIIVLLLLMLLLPGIGLWSIVRAGHVGVVTRFGAVNRVMQPGIAFKIPVIENVTQMETRTQKEQVEAAAASKDLQQVDAKIALNYHLDGRRAVDVYQNVGTEYKERVIDPAMQEAFKAATAKYSADELISQRELVASEVKQSLTNKLTPYHIAVEQFSVVNFDFSREFNAAIEAKARAVQQAQQAENDLRRIEVEAKQTITRAQADAESIRIQGTALQQNPSLVNLKAVEKWDGKLPQYFGGTGPLPFLNVTR